MRILQISSAPTFGGGERHFVDLCKGLVERGHEVFVALRPGNEWQDELGFIPDANISHISLANSVDIISAVKIAGIIRREKIDIVHAHLSRDYPVASLAVRVCPNAGLVLSRHVLFPMKNIHKIALTNVARVIANSQATGIHLRKIFPQQKIKVILYGVDAAALPPDESQKLRREFRFEHNIPFDVPLIGTVGELTPLKGQREFIMAAQLIRKEHPEAFFLSSGKDNSYGQNYRRELKRLVKVLGLKENFVWLDWVSNMKPLYNALDVFVSASHSESFGLAITEAMAAGVAVVATETEGAKELVEDGQSGKLVPIEDPVRLANAVCSLLDDNETQERMGTNGIKFVAENLGMDKMIGETGKLFEEVLAEIKRGNR